jgi:hypothetical protein
VLWPNSGLMQCSKKAPVRSILANAIAPYHVTVFDSRVCVILQSDAELLPSRLRNFRSAEIVLSKQQHRIRELPARRVIG